VAVGFCGLWGRGVGCVGGVVWVVGVGLWVFVVCGCVGFCGLWGLWVFVGVCECGLWSVGVGCFLLRM
jgi:hypothetical protein